MVIMLLWVKEYELCGNKNLKELRNIYHYLPYYWSCLKGMQSRINRPFQRNTGKTIFDLERRFKDEDKHTLYIKQTQGGSTMKKNNTKTNTNDVIHVNDIRIQGTVSHIKSYKTKDGKDLVKGLIKSQGEHGFVSVPFTIWDASNGIPEDDDTLDLHGMLATSSYEKDGHKVYNTYVSVDNYSD